MKEIDEYIQEDGTFENVEVKDAYNIPNVIKYPLVVITEILNSENTRYSTRQGEQVTNLTYQVEALCETTQLNDSTVLSATDSAILLGNKISKLLGGPRYKMARVGQDITQDSPMDNTVKRNIQRYECCLDLKTNTLYRR